MGILGSRCGHYHQNFIGKLFFSKENFFFLILRPIQKKVKTSDVKRIRFLFNTL